MRIWYNSIISLIWRKQENDDCFKKLEKHNILGHLCEMDDYNIISDEKLNEYILSKTQ